jgi:hypothetical integral membrane protein (TIGR02206 family)
VHQEFRNSRAPSPLAESQAACHARILDVILFGLVHIAWLSGIALVSGLLRVLLRSRRIPDMAVRITLACIIVAAEFQRYIHDGIWFPGNLPIQLCNLTAWVAVVACWTLSPFAIEIVYFLGLTGAGLALLSPDMGSDWPARFFITHGSIVTVAIALVYGRRVTLPSAAVWRAWLTCVAYLAFIWPFNLRFGTNYFYIGKKPATPSLLDLMGPYPEWVFIAFLVLLGVFWVLWLPVRRRQSRTEPTASAPVQLEAQA